MLPAVVAGVRPAGGWIPYRGNLMGYVCEGDGNCFWRAAAVQLFGTQERYGDVRTDVVNYILRHPDITVGDLPLPVVLAASGFPSVQAWIAATLTDRFYGGFVEAALLAQCYDVCVQVFTGIVPSASSDLVFNADAEYALRFHYYSDHYNALFVSLQ